MSKVTNFFAGVLIETLIEVFQFVFGDKKSFSRRTLSIMMIVSVAIAFGHAIWKTAFTSRPTSEQKLVRLQEVEVALNELIQFVGQQRQQLQESQDVLERLRKEHEKLRPLVESDRAIVDAVLAAHSEQQATNVWAERGVGFVLGTFGSLVATFIWTFFSNLGKKRRSFEQAVD